MVSEPNTGIELLVELVQRRELWQKGAESGRGIARLGETLPNLIRRISHRFGRPLVLAPCSGGHLDYVAHHVAPDPKGPSAPEQVRLSCVPFLWRRSAVL